ncbi:MAG: hypothetical protein WCK57_01870 [Verrucomicrobiae bacterium]
MVLDSIDESLFETEVRNFLPKSNQQFSPINLIMNVSYKIIRTSVTNLLLIWIGLTFVFQLPAANLTWTTTSNNIVDGSGGWAQVTYSQTSSNLNSQWMTLQSLVPGVDGTAQLLDTNVLNTPNRFYRAAP